MNKIPYERAYGILIRSIKRWQGETDPVKKDEKRRLVLRYLTQFYFCKVERSDYEMFESEVTYPVRVIYEILAPIFTTEYDEFKDFQYYQTLINM